MAARRPLPSSVRIRRCEMIARRLLERSMSNCLRRSSREEIDDAVDGLIGAVGVQRPEAQMSGLGEGDRVLHGLGVADLADENDVRRLAQRVFERVVPGVGIDAHLAVSDERLLRLMHEFDRIFHRDDVTRGAAIAVIDHRGERSRLARAGGADDQHQPALGHHDFFEDLRQPQLGEIGNLVDDGPDHDADVLLLHEDVHAKARHTREGDREIALQLFGEFLALTLVHERVGELARHLGRRASGWSWAS